VAQLHLQALGFLFVASYDSQGYGGGIRPRHNAEMYLTNSCQSTEPESSVTTDGQAASLSWNKALAGLLMWGALSDERTDLLSTIAAGLASAVILGAESRGTRDHILLSQIRDFPFRRLLRLAGLRWTYSTPPSQSQSQSQSYFTTGGLPPINLSWRQAP
jgi:hypothetical protein